MAPPKRLFIAVLLILNQISATMLDVVNKVADAATVPFPVGGGISDVASAAAVLKAGADKVSTSSAAFRRPAVIQEMVKEFGSDRVTVAIDAAVNRSLPSGYEVYIDGGRTATGADPVEWALSSTSISFPFRISRPNSRAEESLFYDGRRQSH